MFNKLKKIWRKIHFLGIFRFLCNSYYILFFVLLIVSGYYFLANGHANPIPGVNFVGSRLDMNRKIDKSLDTAWVQKAGVEPYLNASFTVKEIPFIFTKEHIEKEVREKLKPYNYKVAARKSNRANGFPVKEDHRYESKVRAFYTDDVEVNGKVSTRLWLISDNFIQSNNLENTLKKYEIAIPKWAGLYLLIFFFSLAYSTNLKSDIDRTVI